MRKITLINLLIIITGITALSSAVIYKHYLSNKVVISAPINGRYLPQPTLRASKIEELVNNERILSNLPALDHKANLCGYAQSRLSQITTDFNHDKFQQTAYTFRDNNQLLRISENLSEDTQTSENTVKMWMGSPSHKSAILDPRFTQTCVKCDSKYCVQIFAEPRPTNP